MKPHHASLGALTPSNCCHECLGISRGPGSVACAWWSWNVGHLLHKLRGKQRLELAGLEQNMIGELPTLTPQL